MKIRDFILDCLIETRLFEMAFQRKQALDIAGNLSYQIDTHLLKILVYGTVRDFEHWCDEINGYLRKIQSTKLKNTKKPLNVNTLFKILWEGYLETPDEIRDLISDIDREYSKSFELVNYDYYDVHKRIREILYDVCHDISISQFRDIRNYL